MAAKRAPRSSRWACSTMTSAGWRSARRRPKARWRRWFPRKPGSAEPADGVPCVVRPGGAGVRAEAAVTAVPYPVGCAPDVAGRRIVERAQRLLEQIAVGSRDLPPIGDFGLPVAHRLRQPLEKVVVLRVGVRAQHRHDRGPQAPACQFPRQPVVNSGPGHRQRLGTHRCCQLDGSVLRGRVHHQDARPERRSEEPGEAARQMLARRVRNAPRRPPSSPVQRLP